MNEETIDYKIKGDMHLRLKVDDSVFNPTKTTEFLARSVEIKSGCTVLDLGCGVGPIAIYAAKKGAGEVYAVDIMPKACEYARHNAKLNNVADRIRVLQGDLFKPLEGRTFDVIIDDVSGVAEKVSRLSSWYPEPIPTGGYDGTEPTIRMLTEANEHLNERGILYFPVLSLADAKKIVTKAEEVFGGNLEEILSKRIPLCKELVEKIEELEVLKSQGIIDYAKKGSRYVWFLRIFRASKS